MDQNHNKITVTSGISGEITYINETLYRIYRSIPAGTTLLKIEKQDIIVQSTETEKDADELSFTKVFKNLLESTGIYALIFDNAID